MEANLNRSISAYLDKKRKLHDEEPPLDSLLPNNLFWVQKKLKGNIFESNQESEKGSSLSFGVITSADDQTENSSYDFSSSTFASCLKSRESSFEPSSSSSCDIEMMCSSESNSFENQNSSISQQQLSISEDDDDYYEEDRLLEIAGYNKKDGYEHLHEDLDDYSYVPYSGILPLNQEDEKRRGKAKKKLTIDKEFEQYFSSLML